MSDRRYRPSHIYVSALLSYDPETGELRWKFGRGNRPAGEIAGWSSGGYRHIMIDGRNYKAHRVAWLLMTGAWPTKEIDHRDHDGLNNRWVNLREATSSQNKMNQRKGTLSLSGIRGVFLDKRDGRWFARVTVNGRHHHLGRFSSKEQAAIAYADAAPRLHGEFACQTP